ncbi:MAG: hypothetical protein RSC33_06955, partial [Vagococcus sp.]
MNSLESSSQTTMKPQLSDLVEIFRAMKTPSWTDGGIRGELVITTQEIAEKLNNILKDRYYEDFPCLIEKGKESGLTINDTLIIKFSQPRSAIGFVFENTEHLLNNNEISSGISTKKWFVFDSDTASWENEKELTVKLNTIGKLVKTLSSSATIFNEKKSELIFVNESRFDIPIHYQEFILDNIDTSTIESIYNSFKAEDVHLEQK